MEEREGENNYNNNKEANGEPQAEANDFTIKTEEIFLKYKFEKIPNKFESKKPKNYSLSNASTTASYIKLDNKRKDSQDCLEYKSLHFAHSETNDQVNQKLIEKNNWKAFEQNKITGENKENKPFLANDKNEQFENQEYYKEANPDHKLTYKEYAELLNEQNVQNNVNDNLEEEDIIPFMTKIIYSLASFGKMSCLVLLK